MPNLTAVAAVKLVPVIVTGVPPAAGPLFGAKPVTVGAGGGGLTYVNWSAVLMALVSLVSRSGSRVDGR